MHSESRGVHRQLCAIELIAEGRARRCPGTECAFWENGCVLDRIELGLNGRPEVARLLLDLRRELESGRAVALETTRTQLVRTLDEDEGIGSAPL